MNIKYDESKDIQFGELKSAFPPEVTVSRDQRESTIIYDHAEVIARSLKYGLPVVALFRYGKQVGEFYPPYDARKKPARRSAYELMVKMITAFRPYD